MNIQTEHLENHSARLTVEIPPERLEKARKASLRKIAKVVDIPGFRRGKAPDTLVLRYVGETRVLEDAIDDLGQEIYREALEQSGVNPYGPGSLEDVQMEPSLTFIYTVPLQPSVELVGYRDVRIAYTPPTISDEMVEMALKGLQEQEAPAEESQEPAALGDRITVDLHSFFVDEDEDDEDDDTDEAEDTVIAVDEADEAPKIVEITPSAAQTIMEEEEDEEDEEDDDDHHHSDQEPYIHEHDAHLRLVQGDDEPVAPGFTAAMLGAVLNEERNFKLTFPTKAENAEIRDEIAGRTVEFFVTVKKIEKVRLPELNDEFAATLTERFSDEDDDNDASAPEDSAPEDSAEASSSEAGEGESAQAPRTKPPLTMEKLREKIRKSLQDEALFNFDQDYAEKVLGEMIKTAKVGFPDAMLNEQLNSMIESLDRRLRQQGLTLDLYRTLTGKTLDDIKNDYRSTAAESIKRSLVLFQVAVAEGIQVTADDYNAHIDRTMKLFGSDSPDLRKSFESANVKENIFNRLLQDKTIERLKLIGKGEAPQVAAAEASAAVEAAETRSAEPVAEAAAEAILADPAPSDGQ